MKISGKRIFSVSAWTALVIHRSSSLFILNETAKIRLYFRVLFHTFKKHIKLHFWLLRKVFLQKKKNNQMYRFYVGLILNSKDSAMLCQMQISLLQM